jgi:hypothetical protein
VCRCPYHIAAAGCSNTCKWTQHVVCHPTGNIKSGGIPQGNAAGTTFATIMIEKCVGPARESCPTSVVMPYSDDNNCMDADEARALATNEKCEEQFRLHDLRANEAKRVILNKERENTAKIGGAYIGKEASASALARAEEIAEQIEALASIVEKGGLTGDPVVQTATRALNKCLGASADYLTRVQRIQDTVEGAKIIDTAMLAALQTIYRLADAEIEFLKPQVFLPNRRGGWGFVCHEEMAWFERLGVLSRCIVAILPLIDKMHPDCQGAALFDELDEVIEHCKMLTELEEGDKLWKELELLRAVNAREQAITKKISKKLDGVGPRLRYRFDNVRGDKWEATFDKNNRALQERLASITSKYANRTMGAVLKNSKMHWIEDEAWIAMVRFMSLLPAVPEGSDPCKRCKQGIDDLGEHFLTCKALGLGAPHYSVQTAIITSLKEVTKGTDCQVTATPSLVEYMKPEASVARRGAKQQRAEKPQADIKVCEIGIRSTILFDVRTCAMTVPGCIAEIGQTVKLGEKAKKEQYSAFYSFPQGVSFVPFAIDSHGRIGMEGMRALKAICLRAAGGVKQAEYAKKLSRVIDRISTAHKRAIGRRLVLGARECVDKSSDSRWGTKDYFGPRRSISCGCV